LSQSPEGSIHHSHADANTEQVMLVGEVSRNRPKALLIIPTMIGSNNAVYQYPGSRNRPKALIIIPTATGAPTAGNSAGWSRNRPKALIIIPTSCHRWCHSEYGRCVAIARRLCSSFPLCHWLWRRVNMNNFEVAIARRLCSSFLPFIRARRMGRAKRNPSFQRWYIPQTQRPMGFRCQWPGRTHQSQSPEGSAHHSHFFFCLCILRECSA